MWQLNNVTILGRPVPLIILLVCVNITPAILPSSKTVAPFAIFLTVSVVLVEFVKRLVKNKGRVSTSPCIVIWQATL